MAAQPHILRLSKEIQMLANDPPPGVVCWPVDGVKDRLEAQIQGPEDTPYSEGNFFLEVVVPSRYPFEPPKVRFITPIYHPNIDDGGRICLDTLKMQPAGSWSPCVNMSTLLTSIRLLMAHPNPDDGLMPDITELYRKDVNKFNENALASTRKHACAPSDSSTSANTPVEELDLGVPPIQTAEQSAPSPRGSGGEVGASTEVGANPGYEMPLHKVGEAQVEDPEDLDGEDAPVDEYEDEYDDEEDYDLDFPGDDHGHETSAASKKPRTEN